MFEVEKNTPVEPDMLAEFLARCGWEDAEAATKLGWVLDSSEDWVACRLDGELIAFGRSTRSRHVPEVLLSILVDPRFDARGLGAAIALLLADRASGPVFTPFQGARYAPPGTYLGRR